MLSLQWSEEFWQNIFRLLLKSFLVSYLGFCKEENAKEKKLYLQLIEDFCRGISLDLYINGKYLNRFTFKQDLKSNSFSIIYKPALICNWNLSTSKDIAYRNLDIDFRISTCKY